MFAVLAGALLADYERWVPSALIDKARQQYNPAAADRIKSWQEVMRTAQHKTENEQLEVINTFFNRHIRYASDQQHWNKTDYWATPYEALGSNGGDCEDYVIAKYYSLRMLGVDTGKLRITYVKAMLYNQAHMVLTYYPRTDAEPYVLDNLEQHIRLASDRTDLIPVYSFNAEGLWLERAKGKSLLTGNPNKLDSWTDLRVRMNALGMDI